MAAGLTLRESALPEFQALFALEVARWVDADTLAGHLHTDGELLPGEFHVDTALALREGGPWGAGFPEPVFDGEFGVVETRVVGGRHLKLRLRAPSDELVDAIAFRFLEESEPPSVRSGDRVDAVFRTSVDDYGGTDRLQLVTEWLVPARGT